MKGSPKACLPPAEKEQPSKPQPTAEELCVRRPLLWVLALLGLMALALLMYSPPWETGWPQDEMTAALSVMVTADGRIALNTADRTALCTLPGIGPVKAQAILDYRKEHGRFSSLEELLQVPGIGEKTLAALWPLLTLETDENVA